ncbi:MAG TPA: DUF917 domain-containing protein [Holophagaceae bacterium]|nr:DUF917 domain-containing protein [Holophagaceae bacterium]
MTGPRLDREALNCLLKGASVLGTGGGGSYSRGRAIVEEIVSEGRSVELIDPDRLPPEALGISTAMAGGGLTHAEVERLEALATEPPAVPAARALAAYLGRPIGFVFPLEVGPQNTLEAIRLAAHLGVPVADGDCAGRAVPELDQTTLALFDIPLAPFVGATFQGDLALFTRVADAARGEALCRAMATCSGGLLCLTGFPATGARMREALIPRTLSRCLELGALLGPGRQPAEALAAKGGGRVAFQGRVTRTETRLEGGFFRGHLDLEGTGAFAGERYRVGIQNEFMWAWRNGALDIRCPDLICVVDSDSGLGKVTYGHGFENALEGGEALSVLHLPCAEVWDSPRGRGFFPAPPPAVA